MVPLKQSTAVTKKVGPFLDSTDGDTEEAALTIQKADVRLSKNGGNLAAASADQGASDAGAPYDEVGQYDIDFDATDTNTIGSLKMVIHSTGALIVQQEFMVIPPALYEAMYGSGCPELTGVPSATPDLATMGMLPYQKIRNARITDSNTEIDKISNSAGAVILERDFTDVADVLTTSKVRVP